MNNGGGGARGTEEGDRGETETETKTDTQTQRERERDRDRTQEVSLVIHHSAAFSYIYISDGE